MDVRKFKPRGTCQVAQGETAFEALHDPSNSIEVTMANTEAPIAVISAMEAEVLALCA
jgi:hypothetical protein